MLLPSDSNKPAGAPPEQAPDPVPAPATPTQRDTGETPAKPASLSDVIKSRLMRALR